MKIFISAVAIAAALCTAPVAGAYTDGEIAFVNDLTAAGIINRDGAEGIIDSGWTICSILARGHSRSWVAQQIYAGSHESNGSAGVDYEHAQAMVFYAEADLCPEV